MTTVQLCTFAVDGQWFGVPVTAVQEVMRAQPMTTVPRAPRAVSGLIHLRGKIVTAIDLRSMLGMTPAAPDAERFNMMVRDPDDGAVSLVVDQIGDVLEVPQASFEHTPDTLVPTFGDLVSGVFKLNERLLLLLELKHVTNPEHRKS